MPQQKDPFAAVRHGLVISVRGTGIGLSLVKGRGGEAASIRGLGPQMTLIAMTGWGQEDDKRKTREAGFDHHVTKPVDPDVIEKLIRGRDEAQGA